MVPSDFSSTPQEADPGIFFIIWYLTVTCRSFVFVGTLVAVRTFKVIGGGGGPTNSFNGIRIALGVSESAKTAEPASQKR